MCHSESDSNIAIECILGSLKCILGSLESSDHVTGHVAVKIIHHNTCWSSSDHELCMGKRWKSYCSEHRKTEELEKEEEEEEKYRNQHVPCSYKGMVSTRLPSIL